LSGELITEIGICGKIPSRGDFLSQGLPVNFVDSWNEWLQAVLAVSREQLADSWLETYLTSPVWHFALSAGVCGTDAMMGCLIPSVDRVGRHFPLTLASVMSCSPVQARFQGAWADVFQQHALMTLEDNFNFDSWLCSLGQQTAIWPERQLFTCSDNPSTHRRPAWAIESNQTLDSTMLLHHSYRQQFGRYCLWWTEGSECVPPCTLISAGLPQVSQFAAMLDGDWECKHWQRMKIYHDGTTEK
jgi:type VI secretion system protein ImpM